MHKMCFFEFAISVFDACLDSLDRVLNRCIETNLGMNFEKCHFMVEQGIVLGHIISSRGIEVDPAKIAVISQLSYPSCVQEVHSFLGWFVVMYHFAWGLLGFDVACALFTTILWFFYS